MLKSGAALSRTCHFYPSAVFLRSNLPAEKCMTDLSKKIICRRYFWIRISKSLDRLQNVIANATTKELINPTVSQLLHVKKFSTTDWVQCSSNSSTTLSPTKKQELSQDQFSCTNEAPTDDEISKKFSNVNHSLHIAELDRQYPLAKAKVKEIYRQVETELNLKYVLSERYSFQKKSGLWTCEYNVKWPEEHKVVGKGHTKFVAAKYASLECLSWLHKTEKVQRGKPLIHTKKQIMEIIHKSTPLQITPECVKNMQAVVNEYNRNINSLIRGDERNETVKDVDVNEESRHDLIISSSSNSWQPHKLAERNAWLKNKLFSRKKNHKCEERLPIEDYRETIIEHIEKNQVVLIKGDTGCGKTTQVPQYIMEYYEAKGRGTDCNIIVSQPRRISAISLAERIAEERNEDVGDVVGYQVRLAQKVPQAFGAILFCTTGVLLKKLHEYPTLNGCSHVVLDEAHERSINTDMLLTLLKSAMEANPKLKVVIMSATLNSDLLQKYMNCTVVEVPGKIYPVQMNFIEDMQQAGVFMNEYERSTESVTNYPIIDYDSIAQMINWIDKNKPEGAILTFLPGWAEITNVKNRLENWDPHNRLHIVMAHSKMSHVDQRKIFNKAPPNKRKIVLATDIAETGITVTDVVYVVDSATQKTLKWDDTRGISVLQNQFVAQSNIIQRKGRAGRVRPGISYHMITKEHFNNLTKHPLPEIMCASLEKTVLDSKMYSNEKAEEFLSSLPQPPMKSAVKKALENLVHLGAIDDEENLTPLGKRIALFTLHPKLSKAIVYSAIFQCVSSMITVATAMSSEGDIFSGGIGHKETKRKMKAQYNSTSDHISISWIFNHWNEYAQKGFEVSKAFCRKLYLSPYRIFTLSKVRNIHAQDLVNCQMLTSFEEYEDLNSKFNEYSDMDELVNAILLTGTNQLLFKRDFEIKGGRIKKDKSSFVTEDNLRAKITPESVNYNIKDGPSPFFTYVSKQHSHERRTCLIHDTSIISPITALLFSGGQAFKKVNSSDNDENPNNVNIYVPEVKNLRISCDNEVANTVLQFRNTMSSVVQYLLEKQGLVENFPESDYNKIQEFKEFMLQVIVQTLTEASNAKKNKDSKSKEEEKEETMSDDEYF